MTSPAEILETRNAKTGYKNLFWQDYENIDQALLAQYDSLALQIVDDTYNKKSLVPQNVKPTVRIKYPQGDPTTCHIVDEEAIDPLVLVMASKIMSPCIYDGRNSLLRMDEATESPENAAAADRVVRNLGLSAVRNNSRRIHVVTVTAPTNPEIVDPELSVPIYQSLSQLPSDYFRVAILGTSDATLPSAQA